MEDLKIKVGDMVCMWQCQECKGPSLEEEPVCRHYGKGKRIDVMKFADPDYSVDKEK